MALNEDYGPKIGKALQAIHQMHIDVTKMISLLDKELNRAPVLGRITDQAKFSVNADVWMPQGMHRLYAAPDSAGRVEGITAVFIDVYGEPIEEPLLIVGQAQFKLSGDENLRSILMKEERDWCLWDGYLRMQEGRPLNTVSHLSPGANDDDEDELLQWVRVIAVPLYSLTGIQDVLHLLERIRAHNAAKRDLP